jgi:hypothetical protein
MDSLNRQLAMLQWSATLLGQDIPSLGYGE